MNAREKKNPVLLFRMSIVIVMLAAVYLLAFYFIFHFVRTLILIPMVIVGISVFVQYFFSHKIVKFAMRARVIKREEDPELYQIVETLCDMSGLPQPEIAISDMPVMNAFATGRNSKHALVCVTQQLRDKLNYEELEGVLAHEINHIRHYDAFVITMASFLAIVIAMLLRFISNMLVFAGIFGNRDNDRDGGFAYPLIAFFVGSISYLISFLLIRSLSRYRELAADRSAAYLTGKPSALASALVKISSTTSRIPEQDLRTTNQLSALMFFNKDKFFNLLSTHPSLEQRLKQLNSIHTELTGR